MKLLASTLTLILIGVFGIWLWQDVTTRTEDSIAGVVVSTDGPAPSEEALVSKPVLAGDEEDAAAAEGGDVAGQTDEELTDRSRLADSVVDVLRQAAGGLEESAVLAQADSEERAQAESATGGSAGSSGTSGWSGSAPAPAPAPPVQPQPIQPAPVDPYAGLCWDDDEWEECDDDDWDDDWDDDDDD